MASRISSRLMAKKRDQEQVFTSPALPPLSKKRKTGAEATRDWKARMKRDDPQKYKEYQQRNNEASKTYRKNLTEEQKARHREQSKLRMKAMRARKKEAEPQKPILTRAAQDEQRKKWREAKQKWFESLHPQKKRRLNEKRSKRDREKRAEKKAAISLPSDNTINTSDNTINTSDNALNTSDNAITMSDNAINAAPSEASTSYGAPVSSISGASQDLQYTPAARRKAKSRLKKALPSSPRKVVHILSDVIKNLSPAQKKLFDKLHPNSLETTIGKSVLKKLKETCKRRNKDDLKARRVLLSVCSKYSSLQRSSTMLNISKRSVCSLTSSGMLIKKEDVKKEKKDEEEICSFFESVSCPIPDKKLVSSKLNKAPSVLLKPLKDLHADYNDLHPDRKLSFSHFAKCRPKHVRLQQNWRLRLCLCEYCTNVDLKQRSLNAVAERIDNAARIRHSYHAIDLITCGRQDGQWKKDCVYRECATCQHKSLNLHVAPLLQHQRPVTWLKWEDQVTQVNGKRVGELL